MTAGARGTTAALFVAALAPRVAAALAWAGAPQWDGVFYDAGARQLASGLGYGDARGPWSHYPVGYAAVLGTIYRVFGDGPRVSSIAGCVVGALLAAVTHRLALACLSRRRALVAGVLVAAWPGLVVYAPLVMTETLAGLGIVVAAWAALATRDRGAPTSVLGGALVGLTALVRPPTLLLAPALALFAPRRRARAAAVAAVAALAVVAPWTARNCVVTDGCALVSTNGGWNLAIGAFPRATGRYEPLHESDGCDAARGEVHEDRCWLAKGAGWIAADPARWIALAPKKLGQTFDHESFAIGYLAEADPAAWPEARRARARFVLSTLHRALVAAAPLAFVAWSRARLDRALAAGVALFAVASFATRANVFWPLALAVPAIAIARMIRGEIEAFDAAGGLRYAAYAIASVALTHVVFFGEDRYHVVVTPLFALLAAAALRAPVRGDTVRG